MKKLISLILSIAIIFTVPMVSAHASDEAYDAEVLQNSAKLLDMLGIADMSDSYTQSVTRAEFAVYLANIFSVNSFDKNTDRYYIDVAMDHWALNSINYLYERGILSMNESRTFMPDSVITKSEAYKMSVEAIGYGDYASYQGGYPAGYHIMADRTGISDGVSSSQALTLGDAVIIISNTLKANVLEGYVYSDDSIVYSDENTSTLLEQYHSIYMIEACITAVPGISLTAETDCASSSVVLGGVSYDCSLDEMYDYLGYEVTAYCFKESKKEKSGEIILIEDNGNTEKYVINSDEYLGFNTSDYKLRYEKSGKDDYLNVSKGITVIKNGAQLSNDIANVFNIRKGRIEFLNTDADSEYEYAFVWEYDTLMVSYADHEKEIIYDKLNNTNTIEYGRAGIEALRVFDAKGNNVSVYDISSNTLLTVYESDAYLEIYVSDEGKEETVYSYYTNTAGDIVAELGTSADNTHNAIVDNDYLAATSKTVYVGLKGIFHYDNYGNVAYIEEKRDGNVKFGFLIDYDEADGLDSALLLKLLTENNRVEIVKCAEKTEVDGVDRTSASDIITALGLGKKGVIGQVISYKSNTTGDITDIDTAYYASSYERADSLTLTASAEKKRFTYASKNFGPLTLIDGNTVCFGVPFDSDVALADDEEFIILPAAWFEADLEYTVETYKLDTESGYEDVLVCRGDFESAKTPKSMFVVEKLSHALNADGDDIERVVGYTNGIRYVYDVHTGKSLIDKGIEAGDMIYLILDAAGKVTDCTLFYDYSKQSLTSQWSSANDYNSYYNSNYMAYGNVLSTKDNVLKIGKTSLDTVDIVIPCSNVPITVCEKVNGKVTCSMGSIYDIIGYDVSQTDYARIMIKLNYGTIKEIVIYK